MKILPSILTCDFTKISYSIDELKKRGCEALHLDVMDGVFVPQITFGAKFINDLVQYKEGLFFDTHLMVKDAMIAKQFIQDSDYITVHYESEHCYEAILEINKTKKSGLSIKPGTEVKEIVKYLPLVKQVLVMSVEPGKGGQKFMPLALDKIKELDQLRKTKGYDYVINVDGGINLETAKQVLQAGADFVVSGSFIINNFDNFTKLSNL